MEARGERCVPIVSVNALSIRSQARAISPPTTTASGLKPMIKFEIPTPRLRAVSTSASFALALARKRTIDYFYKRNVRFAEPPDNFK